MIGWKRRVEVEEMRGWELLQVLLDFEQRCQGGEVLTATNQ